MTEEAVSYKVTMYADGTSKKEPLTKAESDAIEAEHQAHKQRMLELMPDEQAAIDLLAAAYFRLRDLGWRDTDFPPAHDTPVMVIENGSTAKHEAVFMRTSNLKMLPNGVWCITGGLFGPSPSAPVLWKPKI
jgi:hypothetical protein